MSKAFSLGLLLLLVGSPASADQKPWTEILSPHFTVLTNGTTNDGRRVAREFEQMRGVFSAGFPNLRLETGAPLLVFAPRDEASMKALSPLQWKGSHQPNIAGYFHHGWEKTYAVIRLDQDRPGSNGVVYHEYVHSLLHANYRWLPTWLDEGLADYYGSSRFEENKTRVGVVGDRMGQAYDKVLIPLDELIVTNPYVAYRGDDRRISLFYSESTALVHYFMFAADMDGGKKLTQFFVKIQQGQNQAKAFQETFGDFKALEKNLYVYLHSFAFGSYVIENPTQMNQKDFGARELTVGETETAIGGLRIWLHDLPDAREILLQAMHDAPQLADAHEYQGFVQFADGKDAEASREFAKAFELNGQDYLALYFKTMLSPIPWSDRDADQVAFREAMLRIIKLNPRFAPASVGLAILYVRWGEMDNALSAARTAESLEPSRAGYHLLVARILERTGKTAQAAKLAQYVAERWTGPDRDEAVEIWNRLPATDRPADMVLTEELEKDAQRIEGSIHAVTCTENSVPNTFTLDRAGELSTYHAAGAFASGFSDTVWFGTDHFQLCHHLEGMRVIVQYKPSQKKEFAGDIAKLEVRDDLPATPSKKAAATLPALSKSN